MESSRNPLRLRLRILPDGLPEGIAGEWVVEAEVIRLGRIDDCDLVVRHPTVSRLHAEIRRTPDGLKIIDRGSANGLWIEGQKVSESVLTPPCRFRIGGVWLELVEDLAQAPAESAPALQVTKPPAAPEPKAERAPEPAPEPKAEPVPEPTPEPKPEPTPEPKAAPKPDPAADDKAEARPAPRSEPESRPVPKAAPPAGAGGGGSGPSDGSLAELFRAEAEQIKAGGNNPFVLDGADSVWWVEEGKVEVFTVPLEDRKPKGARTHFVTVEAGFLMFGMDLARYDFGNGFLAVGSGGTYLRRISVARLRELATDPVYAEEIGGLVDHWVQSLSRSLTKEIIPGPVVDVLLDVGEETELANRQTARSSRGVCWIEAIEGNLIFIGMEELVFEGESSAPKGRHSMNIGLDDLFAAAADRVGHNQTLFPISFDTWIEATNPRREQTTRVLPHRSAEIASRAGMWDGLQLFHRVLCQCEFVNKRLEMVDEFNRLKTKAEYSAAARESALREIASVMQQQDEATAAAAAAGDLDPVYTACKLVGEVFGMEIVPHPEADRKAPFDDRVAQIAKASRFRTRQVVLRGSWWTGDHGPILGRIEETDQPIALIPKSVRSYQAINPTDGTAQPVTQAFADTLAPFGTVFYPPLPDSGITGMTMIKLGARGVLKDVGTLAAMGIGLGLLGTLTPFFTGKLFDTAIPEAEKGLVFQFTIALFIAAMVSSAFKITQSIATLRIQGKMDYKLQAAVWDRLLDLPSTFFRDYSSGDLADRAQGINTIRHYIAGAGVSSILGSLSSLFYVGLMFTYDMMMAFLAMFLTFVFISFTFVCNYLQLRYQRDKLALQGKITGMVLQLIAGVGKLRVSGAENHAFRIWAREFSQQRRIEFIIGRVQNAVQVFNTGFPVMANMAIFWTVISLMQSAAERGEQGGGMTTGDFIAFTAAYGAFQGAMMQLSNASLDLLRVVPVWERLKPIITTPAEIDNSKAYPGRLKGGIEVSHVTFRYSEDSPLILNDLSLNIQPGEFVAFVGGSGCGKSTLMRLMLGFEIPEKGSIYYDGQDLANLDVREVRQQIGVVLQNSQLFPSELYKNIIGTSSLTIDDAWEAAKMASLDKDIEDMPMGMHTYVSEGGGGLSGGQRQRLIIARALVRKPRILFLDEATSALDNRSQATVTESMQKIQATRIVIAHRLSTILHADRICYLKDGKVAEQGTYDELMEMKGLFYELASRQMA